MPIKCAKDIYKGLIKGNIEIGFDNRINGLPKPINNGDAYIGWIQADIMIITGELKSKQTGDSYEQHDQRILPKPA